ncbi:MAG TPA: aldose 1-epimerase family protein [Mycobacteriales bacterium]|nr:aldose 1-epimerase family protein [Mycobacteriales bacterium]
MTDGSIPAPVPPSGEQHEISAGAHHAVVVAVGGGLRTYTYEGRDILDGYGVDVMADGARGQTLAPWPNRVKDGTWTWQGRQQQLALTEPAQHNAIHGLVRWLGWSLVERSEAEVTLEATSYPQTGYPWPVRVRNTYRLAETDGLTVTASITNVGDSDAPVASGAHPYLTVGTPTIDDVVLHVPADTWLPTGEQQIPTGRQPVAGTPYDFRTPRRIGDTEIDYAFTDLHRDGDGRCRVRLESPAGTAVTFWVDGAYALVEVFTGDALPDESKRRRGLGLEPMSAPPNALATGESLCVLAPGETWVGQWGITPS